MCGERVRLWAAGGQWPDEILKTHSGWPLEPVAASKSQGHQGQTRRDGVGCDGMGWADWTVMALVGCPLWPAPEALAVSFSEEKIVGHFSEEEEEEECRVGVEGGSEDTERKSVGWQSISCKQSEYIEEY